MFGKHSFVPGTERINALVTQVMIVFAALFLVTLIGLNLLEVEILIAMDVAVLLFLFCLKFTQQAFYLMILVYPFIGWNFTAQGIRVPIVDVLAIFIFTAWIIKRIRRWKEEPFTWKDFPGIGFAVLFFVSGLLSLTNAAVPLESFKYLLRPVVFFYFMYLVLPFQMIRDRKVLHRVYQILFVVGIGTAFMGLLSILVAAGPWYTRRAVPYVFGNLDLLGGNQNAIAEVLIVVLPVTLILMALTKKIKSQSWLLVGAGLMTAVLLLTFSRAGWLALLLELLLLVVFRYRRHLNAKVITPVILSFVLLPLLFYFSVWQDISWIRTSNQNRLFLSEIAITSFIEHPVIGNGLNSFQSIVADTFVYTVEFGDPLESHGFIQKQMTEQGLLGVLSFLGLLGFVFFQLGSYVAHSKSDSQRFIAVSILMMVSGIVFFELFSTSYYISRMWLPVGVALAAVNLRDH